jgi:hypothetical protein
MKKICVMVPNYAENAEEYPHVPDKLLSCAAAGMVKKMSRVFPALVIDPILVTTVYESLSRVDMTIALDFGGALVPKRALCDLINITLEKEVMARLSRAISAVERDNVISSDISVAEGDLANAADSVKSSYDSNGAASDVIPDDFF